MYLQQCLQRGSRFGAFCTWWFGEVVVVRQMCGVQSHMPYHSRNRTQVMASCTVDVTEKRF